MAVVLAMVMGYLGLSVLGGKMGKFSVEKMLETASVTQKDLKQDYYQGSSFDIGDFEPTVGGMLTKVPIAMRVGLFQPFVWEARNVVMIFSGLENLIYLLIAVFPLFKILRNPRRLFRILDRYPILIYVIGILLHLSLVHLVLMLIMLILFIISHLELILLLRMLPKQIIFHILVFWFLLRIL